MALDPELKMVFEHLDQKIDVLVEARQADREKLDATFDAVGVLQEDMVEVKGKVDVLQKDMTEVKGKVGVLEENVVEIKAQLDLIRGDLKAKADRTELHLLEERVTRLERRMAAA
ncbi:hypothetical protein HYV74_01450 [Candidatus Uhrbacteria bacterium]|nr:hypothetical protein [Candidatus Uhrbacteria bacterium]